MSQYDEQVSASTEDGATYTGSNYWSVLNNYLAVGNNQVGFFRFNNLPMGQGATIDSAYFKVWTHEYGFSNSVQLKIRAIDQDDTAAFPSSNGTNTDPLNRPRTSAGIDFDFDGTRNVLRTSPDIKTVIQEIIDRAGWTGGNDLAIVLENDGSAYNNELWPYDYGSAKAAELIINYTGISTHQQQISAAAHIINPTLDYGIIVMKSTYDVLTDKNPAHQVFNSDYGTLKYFVSGSVEIYLAAGYLAAVQSYEHNLGYIPFVEVYAETVLANRYQYAPYSGAGATVLYGVTYRITSTHIYFYAESTGFAGDTTFKVKFFLFRNDLDL
jgi:hypothetical protein